MSVNVLLSEANYHVIGLLCHTVAFQSSLRVSHHFTAALRMLCLICARISDDDDDDDDDDDEMYHGVCVYWPLHVCSIYVHCSY